VSSQRHSSVALLPGKSPSNHFTGGWVGRGADLDGYGKSFLTGDRIRTVQPVVSRYTDVIKQYSSDNLRNMTGSVKVKC